MSRAVVIQTPFAKSGQLVKSHVRMDKSYHARLLFFKNFCACRLPSLAAFFMSASA
jgi:hypothetical protein